MGRDFAARAGCKSRPCPLAKHFPERIAASGNRANGLAYDAANPRRVSLGIWVVIFKCGSNGAVLDLRALTPEEKGSTDCGPARVGEGKRSRLVVSTCSRSNSRGYVVFSLRAVLESNARRAISTTMTRAGWLRKLAGER